MLAKERPHSCLLSWLVPTLSCPCRHHQFFLFSELWDVSVLVSFLYCPEADDDLYLSSGFVRSFSSVFENITCTFEIAGEKCPLQSLTFASCFLAHFWPLFLVTCHRLISQPFYSMALSCFLYCSHSLPLSHLSLESLGLHVPGICSRFGLTIVSLLSQPYCSSSQTDRLRRQFSITIHSLPPLPHKIFLGGKA